MTATTRNQVNLGAQRLLRWNNWFYAGEAGLLQSSEQGINQQGNIGGGIGRYLMNSNHAKIYLLGGFAWQQTNYAPSVFVSGAQNVATGLVVGRTEVLSLQQDHHRVYGERFSRDLATGTGVHERECVVLHQAVGELVVECFVLRELGQPASADVFGERLRDEFGVEHYVGEQVGEAY